MGYNLGIISISSIFSLDGVRLCRINEIEFHQYRCQHKVVEIVGNRLGTLALQPKSSFRLPDASPPIISIQRSRLPVRKSELICNMSPLSSPNISLVSLVIGYHLPSLSALISESSPRELI